MIRTKFRLGNGVMYNNWKILVCTIIYIYTVLHNLSIRPFYKRKEERVSSFRREHLAVVSSTLSFFTDPYFLERSGL